MTAQDYGRLGGRPPLPAADVLRAQLLGEPRAWRIGEIMILTGFNKPRILVDIELGELAAYRVPCGSKFEYAVAHAEAVRYITPFL